MRLSYAVLDCGEQPLQIVYCDPIAIAQGLTDAFV